MAWAFERILSLPEVGAKIEAELESVSGAGPIVILEVFGKKTKKTPKYVIDATRKRLKQFLQLTKDE